MKQTFAMVAVMLDKVTKISKRRYTHEDYASSRKGIISKEQLAKEKEGGEVIRRIVKQLNFITQYVTKAQQINVVQVVGILPYEFKQHENDHDEEEYLFGN